MAKLSLRQFFNNHPWLDSLRLSFLAWGCVEGLTWLDNSFNLNRIYSPGARKHLLEEEKPVVYAVYHGRMCGLLGLRPRDKVTVLISQSRDGLIATNTALGMGFAVARGSHSRGAVQGALGLLTAVEKGQSVAFLVDGPRGPIYEVKPGIVRLAGMAGIPILPVVCHARTFWTMKSWDKFMASCWGTPVTYVYGDPIFVPAEASEEQLELLCQELNQSMSTLKDKSAAYWSLN